MSKKIVIGIGEILWDVFGEEKRLGGAPANFAHHASQTGAEGVAVSAVGDDALGDAIFAELAGKTLRAEFQRVSGVPTGAVAVSLDASGSARYVFPSDSAWDHLAFTERLRDLAARADAVCFGTLMQRSETSRGTVRAFLRATPENALRVFDANLRADFYSEKLVRESLALANVLKINEDELRVLGGFFGVPAGDAFAARRDRFFEAVFAAFPRLRFVVLTCGGDGSFIAARDGEFSFVAADAGTRVVDTVGAGDSFTATFTTALLAGRPLAEAHRLAADVSAFVCSRAGAMPELPDALKARL